MSESLDELHTGYPIRKGWYECVVEGITMPLYLNVCTMKNSKEWLLPDRTPVDEDVKWVKAIDRPVL